MAAHEINSILIVPRPSCQRRRGLIAYECVVGLLLTQLALLSFLTGTRAIIEQLHACCRAQRAVMDAYHFFYCAAPAPAARAVTGRLRVWERGRVCLNMEIGMETIDAAPPRPRLVR